jgi:hypothetical protein
MIYKFPRNFSDNPLDKSYVIIIFVSRESDRERKDTLVMERWKR